MIGWLSFVAGFVMTQIVFIILFKSPKPLSPTIAPDPITTTSGETLTEPLREEDTSSHEDSDFNEDTASYFQQRLAQYRGSSPSRIKYDVNYNIKLIGRFEKLIAAKAVAPTSGDMEAANVDNADDGSTGETRMEKRSVEWLQGAIKKAEMRFDVAKAAIAEREAAMKTK